MIRRIHPAKFAEAARSVVRLPPSRNDPDYARVRAHDVEGLCEQTRAPHVAASYASRSSLMTSLIL